MKILKTEKSHENSRFFSYNKKADLKHHLNAKIVIEKMEGKWHTSHVLLKFITPVHDCLVKSKNLILITLFNISI